MPKLMISISGMRGVVGEGLTPEVIVNFAQAFGTYAGPGKIVVGRDTRITGEMVKYAVLSGLQAVGCTVVDVGICPTPTIQLATEKLRAKGGIAITASHNPIQWNALKLIGPDGLFLDAEQGQKVVELVEKKNFLYAPWNEIGKLEIYEKAIEDHVEAILNLPYIDVEALRKRRFKVVLDCVNGAGSVFLPSFLDKLGCQVTLINCVPDGLFPRVPEPLPENLGQLCQKVKEQGADIGFAVDPDSDRLAIVSEQGIPLGEEYTLALAVKFILERKPGMVVVNASSSKATDDIAREYGVEVIRTKVGEIHVARRIREVGAVIGGEGNGGVILPEVHLGRDAPVGVALTLQYLTEFGGTISQLYDTLPRYYMTKGKIELENIDPLVIMERLREDFANEVLDLTDGLKILWPDSWVHIRPSNTEPIIRVLTEAKTEGESVALCRNFIEQIKEKTSSNFQ